MSRRSKFWDAPFHLNTPTEYHDIVVQAGFSEVSLEDLTPLLAEKTLQDLANIDSYQKQIVDRFGKEASDYAKNSWYIQGKAFQERELLVGLIKGHRFYGYVGTTISKFSR